MTQFWELQSGLIEVTGNPKASVQVLQQRPLGDFITKAQFQCKKGDSWGQRVTHTAPCLSHAGFGYGQEQFWKLRGELSSRACSKVPTRSSGPEQCKEASKEI